MQIVADLSNESDTKKVMSETIERFKKLDILVGRIDAERKLTKVGHQILLLIFSELMRNKTYGFFDDLRGIEIN